MRDKAIALSGVAIAGLAVVVGLTIGAAGGAFDDDNGKVQPPALRSDLGSAVLSTATSAITVPPSPSWRVAEPTTPRVTTSQPTTTAATTADGTSAVGTAEQSIEDPTESTRRTPRPRRTTVEPTEDYGAPDAFENSYATDDTENTDVIESTFTRRPSR